MITQETAAAIWHAYREIATAEKLLADMKAEREKPFSELNKHSPTIKDAFGRPRHLELGIPSGDNSHRIFQVNPQMAESIIRSHIGQKQAELVDANERARIELSGQNA
ncbi:MAG: hypothetical protein H8M99_01550 [Gloeobacteraceae cyanobacterium ES-bin-144]|nr:hypothetical protein [Verrucomicrobiales bacterium]